LQGCLPSQPVRYYAHGKNSWRQEPKEAGGKLYFETHSLEQFSKNPPAIPAVVASNHVCLGPQSLIRRNSQINAPVTGQVDPDCLQKFVVVLHVFHHVEQTDGGETSRNESGILECGMHHLLDSSPSGVHNTRCPGFYEHYFQPRILHRPGDEPVATADIEERTCRRKLAYRFEDTGVAMPEPER